MKREQDSTSLPSLKVVEKTGDLFEDAGSTVLAHACNCQGKWGAGIAAAFKKKYPGAFKTYEEHCRKNSPETLIGTALLIAPEEGKHSLDTIPDTTKTHQSVPDTMTSESSTDFTSGPWIACLFISIGHGKQKDTKDTILANTHKAMQSLLSNIHRTKLVPNRHDKETTGPSTVHRAVIQAIRMPRINSGLFNVPWHETKAVLESVQVRKGQFLEVEVVSPPVKGDRGTTSAAKVKTPAAKRGPPQRDVEEDKEDSSSQESSTKSERAPLPPRRTFMAKDGRQDQQPSPIEAPKRKKQKRVNDDDD